MESGTAKLGMMVARQATQEEKNHHDDQADGQHQLELHVFDGGADGGGAVGQNGRPEWPAGSEDCSCGSKFLDAVDDGDDVGAGLALNIQNDGGRFVDPGGLPHVFGAVENSGDVGEPDRAAIAIGNDQRPVAVAGNAVDRWRRWCRPGACRRRCLWPGRRSRC